MPGEWRNFFGATLLLCMGATCLAASKTWEATVLRGSTFDSLECIVAESGVIVVGRVTSFDHVGWPSADGRRLTLTVDETIKGRAPARITFLAGPMKDDPPYLPLERVVLFMLNRRALEANGGAINTRLIGSSAMEDAPFDTSNATAMRLYSGQLDAATMDGSYYTQQEDILRSLRMIALTEPPATHRSLELQMYFQHPRPLANTARLRVPVDVRLEQLGQRWASIGRDYLALEALRQFPSAQNAAIVRKYLASELYEGSARGPSSVGRFPLRATAYDILHSWKVPVERPVINEPYDWFKPFSMRLAIAASLIAWIGVTWFVWRLIWRGQNPWAIATTASILLGVFVVTLWIRSLFQVDMVCAGPGTPGYLIRTSPGRLQIRKPGGLPIVFPTAGWMRASIPVGPAEMDWLRMAVIRSRQGALGVSLVKGTEGAASSPFSFRRVEIHFFTILLCTTVIPALHAGLWTGLRLRARRRVRQNRCPACGYDLRATPGRCPECGWRTPSS